MKDEQIAGLLGVLGETHDHEIDCEQFLDRVARYADLKAANTPIPDELAPVVEHEKLCANCREECAALVDAISEVR
ncbi:MAG: hypothetical protein QM831_15190 [Kofleriaceae bacterium]